MSQRAKTVVFEAVTDDLARAGIRWHLTGSRAVGKHGPDSDYDVWVVGHPAVARILYNWGAKRESEGYAASETGEAWRISNAVHVIVVPPESVGLREEVEEFVKEHAAVIYMLDKEQRRELWRRIWDRIKREREEVEREELERR